MVYQIYGHDLQPVAELGLSHNRYKISPRKHWINTTMENNKVSDMQEIIENKEESPKKPDEKGGFHVEGHIKIFDPATNEIFIDKRNAIHYENMSIAMANSLANQGTGFIYQMVFGNGGTIVDSTGLITYLTPNTNGINSSLYNQTYSKIVDANSSLNVDPTRNKMEIRHIAGATYTDIVISCLLDYGEPNSQEAFDNATDLDGEFVFDELGLRGYDSTGSGKLLTHVVFHPVQKSLNRLIQIDYTIRVQSLTGFTEV